jgi:hypothetical protein
MVFELAIGVQHVRIPEIALFDRPPKSFEYPIRHWHLVYGGRNNLKNAGLQDNLGVSLLNKGRLLPRSLEIADQVCFATPETKASPDEFGSGVFEHAYIVFKVAPPVKQTLHGN